MPFIRLILVALIAALYLLPGTLGHAPWKQDETYTFGIIHHFMTSHEWVIPVNAGEPFMEKPPLYFWLGSALAWLFSSFLPLPDGARMASVLFGATTFVFAARAAKSAFATSRLGDKRVIGTLALMAGTPLLIKHVHDMFSDVALLAGTAIGLSALIRIVLTLDRGPEQTGTSSPPHRDGPNFTDTGSKHRIKRGDIAGLGIGVGIAFMSKGLFIPGVFVTTILLLPVCVRACRSHVFFRAIAASVLVSSPFLLIWPALLYHQAPNLFRVWFWENNVGRFLGFSVAELGAGNQPDFILTSMLTSGFPLVYLALLGLLLGGWRTFAKSPALRLCWLFTAIGVTILSFSATARQLYLLPFVLPGALLAANALKQLPLWLMSAWDWSSRVLFATFGCLVWLVWWHMLQPASERLSEPMLHGGAFSRLGRWLPLDYVLPLQPLAIAAALILSLTWLAVLRTLRQQRQWRGPLSWCAGMTLCWGLTFTLLLPWIDYAKSYTSVFESMKQAVKDQWQGDDCMASIGLGESEAPMMNYVAGILHRPIAQARGAPLNVDTACRWLIIERHGSVPITPCDSWWEVWQGSRPDDTQEHLTVYRRH